jgi:hypothetical protein
MEAHLALLLAAAAAFERRELGEDALHVWWGEEDENRECHLYLTDYRSLYVAHVDAITQDDIRASRDSRVPAYYASAGLDCDFWYRLLDVRRLVADDTVAVIAELKTLRNLGYINRPVSLYGGMVDLPLVGAMTPACAHAVFGRGR